MSEQRTRIGEPSPDLTAYDVALECGWGRLVFGQTFSRGDTLAAGSAGCRPAGRTGGCRCA